MGITLPKYNVWASSSHAVRVPGDLRIQRQQSAVVYSTVCTTIVLSPGVHSIDYRLVKGNLGHAHEIYDFRPAAQVAIVASG